LWPVSFHYYGSVTPLFPGSGDPYVAEIMKTETLFSDLLYGIG
jgi:hypothetical protein